jgi:hypothetical protein
MPSGYENSPDYGGPEPDPLVLTVGVLLFLVVFVAAWRFHLFG